MNKKTRLRVYEKYGGRCAYCGEFIEFKDMQVDHIIPLCRGLEAYDKEKDLFENYNPACRACNFRKGMLPIEEFRKVISNGLNVLNRNFTFRFLKKYGLIAEQNKEVIFFFECMEKENEIR